ncbi:putative PfkB family kinase [Clathrospora elynae]|uniref:Putative PfkB family kinase n=1 Tax=Clathrospora elynae TaxID=706981 RepID=A0A6A5TFH0_9PLEO|nr:putative PfkB family kinase [Clathrospora elynae]
MEASVDFVSLGMAIMDEIRSPSQPPHLDVLGGSGIYSTLGYRLFASRTATSRVGCLVLLEAWNTNLVIKVDEERLSTRGLLEYEDDTFGPKKFQYKTPPLKTWPAHLINTPLLGAKAFHFFATAEEVTKQHGLKERPLIVWEPFPTACAVQNRQAFMKACKYVDLFSPNHLELSAPFENTPSKAFQPEKLEIYASEFSEAMGRTGNGIVIVRAGEHGSLTVQAPDTKTWLPPYYSKGAKEIADPTGAGNTFLGGFIRGWNDTYDTAEASIYGNVAASFAIEQIGLPSLKHEDQKELWNGVDVMGRHSEYKNRPRW